MSVETSNQPEWATRAIGALAVLAGAVATYSSILRAVLEKRARKRITLEAGLKKVEEELAAVREEFLLLKNEKLVSIERRLFHLELQGEDDRRELLGKVSSLERNLRIFNAEVRELREHLENGAE
jgi:hypothetical protein